jgi:sec-independent protein translocase protein TatB
VFNLSGSELVFLVLIALVVLGPDKLPEAMRKAGKAYADFKKMTSGFQSEMRSVLDEPMRELRETAELAKKAASWDTDLLGTNGTSTKPVSGKMFDPSTAQGNPAPEPVTAASGDGPVAPADNDAVDATTRRLHAQAAADLAGSMEATKTQPTAVVASGQMSGFSPAAAPTAEAVADGGAGDDPVVPDADQVVAE